MLPFLKENIILFMSIFFYHILYNNNDSNKQWQLLGLYNIFFKYLSGK